MANVLTRKCSVFLAMKERTSFFLCFSCYSETEMKYSLAFLNRQQLSLPPLSAAPEHHTPAYDEPVWQCANIPLSVAVLPFAFSRGLLHFVPFCGVITLLSNSVITISTNFRKNQGKFRSFCFLFRFSERIFGRTGLRN